MGPSTIVFYKDLTLKGLSLFFKILPISNTVVSAAYILATVHFLYPKLNLAPFSTWSTSCLPGLESPQALHRTKFSVLPLSTATGANKTTPLYVGTSFTHDIGFYSNRNISATHQIAWAGSLNPQIAWALRPLRTPVNRGTLPYKIPSVLVI